MRSIRGIEGRSARVLIVDDEPLNRRLLEVMLVREGYSLVTAASGEEALAVIAKDPPDLILLDLMMPGLDGYVITAKLKSDAATKNIPIILVTVRDDREARLRGLEAGAEDFLSKPVDRAELCVRVRNLLRLKAYGDYHDRYGRLLEGEVGLRTTDLRASEARYRCFFESGIIGVMITERSTGTVRDANDTFLKLVGHSRASMEAGALSWQSLTPAELNTPAAQAVVERELATRDRAVPWEMEYLHQDGTRVPVLVGVAVIDDSTRLTVVTDLTQRKRAEERKAAVVSGSLDAVIVMNQTGTITEFSPAAERTFGYTSAEALGQTLTDLLVPTRHRSEYPRGLERDRLPRAVPTLGKRIETTAVNRSGVEFPIELSVTRVDSGMAPTFVGFMRDISDRKLAEQVNKALEEQLRQSQKMDAVGKLAGGIAHDFNNLLSVVLSYSEMVIADLEIDSPIRQDLEEIYRAGVRAADLTRQLLMFSRQQVIDPKVLDLNEVLANMDKMLRRVVGEDVELTFRPGASIGRVRADPGSIEQVVMNLVINARDAMPTGGKITMETLEVVLDDEYVRSHLGARPGPHVLLSVTDTGTGMDPATLARIFEPFFTTKPQGKGTGLGLSTVFGIAHQSGGTLWVSSEPGVGSSFKMYLPSVSGPADETRPMLDATELRGTETILLVEDEEQVRDVARGILRRHGYTVIEASNAGEALLVCEQHQGIIHLLLSDVVMPQMSGPELAKRLVRMHPEMKVLCMSGYTDDAAVHHGVIDREFAFLQKPLTVESLTRKVRAVLDVARRGS